MKIRILLGQALNILVVLAMTLGSPLSAFAASGDFSLDFAAAAPYSYNHLTGGGAFDDGTIGKNADVVESLEGGDYACGDVVTYLMDVTVANTAQADIDAPQTIELDFTFLAETTGQSGAALGDIVYVGVNYGTIQDLIPGENTVDDGIIDDGGSTATLINEQLTGPLFTAGSVLKGTVVLTDLERNEKVVVRIDVKLFCKPGSNPTGNLQADLTAARLTYIKGNQAVTPPQAIPGGAQTIPFKQIGDMTAPAIDVQKTVTTADGTCPGAETLSIYAGETVKYCYVVTNPSNVTDPPGAPLYNVTLVDDNGTPADTSDDFTVTLTGLTDVYLDGTANDLVAGGTATGSAQVTRSTVGTVVNTATAKGYDAIIYPTAYTDTDTASVTINPPPVVAPQPRVIKGNADGNDTVATLNEPGGSVTFNVVVYNDAAAGTGDATLTALTDNIYGNITTTGHNGITATTCATGGVIAGGGSYSCSFTVSITSEPATITDTLTATLQNTHSTVSDTDQANVVISNVMPTVDLTKVVTPASREEPGGVFDYTLTIKNTSSETVTITALTDDNPLPAGCTGLIGQTLAAGASVSCTYSVTHTDPGVYPNTASVTVQDNDGSTASDSDSKSVSVTDVLPTVDLTKQVTPSTLPEPGGVFTYTLTITNTSIEPVKVADLTDDNPLPSGCTGLIGQTIAAGDSLSCTYTVTHTEPGEYPNTANVVVHDNDGNSASDSDSETVTVTDVAPTVDLTKSVTPASLAEPGGAFHFTLTIKNTSVEDVTITALTDDNPLSADCTDLIGDVLTPGQSVSCTYDVTHTEAGSYDNTASVTVEDNEGEPASDSDSETVTVTDVLPTVDLTKAVTPDTLPEPGGIFTYTLTIKNNSVEAVTITALTDTNALSPECQALMGTSISAGGTVSCTYMVTHTEAGSYPNTASVTVEDNEGNPASDSDSKTVTVTDMLPDISVTKVPSPASMNEPGGLFTFTYVVTNNGVETVTLTSVTDSVIGPITLPADVTLAPGESTVAMTGTWTYTEAGTYPNTVTAVASDNEGNSDTATADASVTVIDALPTVDLTKAVTPASLPEPGGVFHFTLTITNTSVENVTITALTDDNPLPAECTGLIGTVLIPGQSVSCTYGVTHTETGTYPNTASVTVKDNENNSASDSDDATVTITNVSPTIVVDKTANPTSLPEPGGNVEFTVVVTNTSVEPVTLNSLMDNIYGNLDGQGTCDVPQTIAVGGSYTCKFTGAVSGEPGFYTDTVTAVAVDNENTEATASDDATVELTNVSPTIMVDKTANPTSVPETGGLVQFTFTVTNTSFESVTITSLSDSVYGSLAGDADCQVNTVLAPGASCSFSITRSVSGDFGGPDHVNTFTAEAVDNDGTSAADDDSASVSFSDVPPHIQITKTADPTHVPETGGNVTFTFLVENTGNQDVTLTELTDTVFGDLDGQGNCVVPQTILIDGSYSCSITVFLSSDSLTAHYNVSTATAVDDDNTPATDTDDETVTFDDVKPDITITKTANPTHVPETGGNVTFTFLVKNIGQEDVTLTTLSDTVFGDLNGQGDCVTGDLIPIGGSYTCSITRFLSSDSLTAHYNVTTAVGTDDDGSTDTATDDETVTFDDVAPMIRITKSADPTHVPETGGDVTFTFLVENIGQEDVTLTVLTDTVFGNLDGKGTCDLPQTILIGGSYSCEYTVFLASDSLTDHYNVSTATGVDDDNTPATDDDDETVTFDDVAPMIRMTKTASPSHVPETGGDVTFTFLVENIGKEDVTLTSLSDTVFGDLNGQGTCVVPQTILIGGSYSCSITVFLSSDSLTAHYNVSTATAVDDDDTPATDDDDETVKFDDVAPMIRMTKTATPTSVPETGGDVTFTFMVENIGQEDVTLTTLSDTVFGNLDGKGTCDVPQTILIGGSYSCTYTVFLASDSLTDHYNVSTATAVDDDNTPATDDDDETVTFTNVPPTLDATKTANPTQVPETGGNVIFTFTVKNTSAEAVTITSLSDDKYGTQAGDADCKVGTVLAAGASCDFSITKWVEGDYSGPDHKNVFTAKAKDNDGSEATASDDATVDFTNVLPTIEVTKTASPAVVLVPGANVTFTFVVKNTSSEEAVTITSLEDSIYGTLAGDDDCKVDTILASGASCSFSITKFVGADVPGMVTNVFTAKAVDNDNTEASDNDDATVEIFARTSQITPTQTNCAMYRDGKAQTLSELAYGVNKGKINSVAPGMLFYWSTITAPSASFKLEGHQYNDMGWKRMKNQDVFLWDANCIKVQTTTLKYNKDGDPYLLVNGAVPGAVYYFSVKYDTSSLAGIAVKKPYPTATYTFETWLNDKIIFTSPNSVLVKPK